jgi:uncharacterized membrane protein YfcA
MSLAIAAGAGFLAGAMNAAAGGGSFVSLPALVWLGVPALSANISSTIALWPAGLASAKAFWEDFRPFSEVPLWALTTASLIGGGVGALLLLFTPQSAFDAVIPWLLLLATLTFAFGEKIRPVLQRMIRIGPLTLIVVQFVLAIYGGYFGGAVGIMMMAAWTLLGGHDLHRMNPVRSVLVSATNGVAVVCFLIAGNIWWSYTLAMLLGATVGGYVGARAVRRLDPQHLRVFVLALTAVITVVFFVRAH